MRRRYQVQFEQRLGAATSLINYEYLDILDRGCAELGLSVPPSGVVCDIGCASFGYAAALHAFFKPSELIGIEVEGHRLFRNGHTRVDYATGYLRALPNSRFMVADYVNCDLPAHVITAWFPFVTARAILAWRLPLSLLKPDRLFAQVHRNLKKEGCFLMVNHGAAEAALAHVGCRAAGMRQRGTYSLPGVLSEHRLLPAVLSIWTARESLDALQHDAVDRSGLT